jgi:hypothetical protein
MGGQRTVPVQLTFPSDRNKLPAPIPSIRAEKPVLTDRRKRRCIPPPERILIFPTCSGRASRRGRRAELRGRTVGGKVEGEGVEAVVGWGAGPLCENGKGGEEEYE